MKTRVMWCQDHKSLYMWFGFDNRETAYKKRHSSILERLFEPRRFGGVFIGFIRIFTVAFLLFLDPEGGGL